MRVYPTLAVCQAKYFPHFAVILVLSALLSGFFFSKPSWQQINRAIDRNYPEVSDIGSDSLKHLLNSRQAVTIIDVRGKKEYRVSHLPGAIHSEDPTAIQLPKSSTIVVYCSVGIRSAAFARSLIGRGYKKVHNLRGGIFEWANKDYPLSRNGARVHAVHPYDKNWGTLVRPELHATELQ
ncbi:rhodanese-like domain-containing protein [Desulforhopalus singaporensis]|uniref:Rhodanese-related sulfurtransferase n=1 Tax=Desulforhopalus singaporensis TaxID=91360 RepID=A0A1H0U0B7_9BACT|nr:rhodanese-like domain-containing protein [Desulforhopalus singaporensis]SDP59256.1 Rhodanese-related sulfurtransferase [Desulforhopalus singaporensis]